jgi:RNA polymerase sigma-70 factor (ECF subfamily)
MPESEHRATGRDVPDETLMARYADGDEEAFGTLFERYEPRAYVFFLKRTWSPERAQDLYQELFLRVHRARDRYDPQQPFTPWFFKIANRLLVDDYRRAFRSHEVPLEDREPRTSAPGSEEVVADREYAALVLGALSPEERHVVLSAKVQGIGYPELAEHLGKSVEAVKKMASRAIQRLRSGAPPDVHPLPG